MMDSDDDFPAMRVLLLTLPGAAELAVPFLMNLKSYLPPAVGQYIRPFFGDYYLIVWCGFAPIATVCSGLALLTCLRNRPVELYDIRIRAGLMMLNAIAVAICVPVGIFFLIYVIWGFMHALGLVE